MNKKELNLPWKAIQVPSSGVMKKYDLHDNEDLPLSREQKIFAAQAVNTFHERDKWMQHALLEFMAIVQTGGSANVELCKELIQKAKDIRGEG